MKYKLDIQYFATDDTARALAVGGVTKSKQYTDDEIKKLAGGFVFKGKVATRSLLPSSANNGDVYLIEDEGRMVVYYSGEWINYSTAIVWGSIEGTLNDQEDLKDKLDTLSLITETGNKISLSVDSEYKVTATLYDKNNNQLSSSMIDLPIESVIISGRYDAATKSLILTLQNGNTITIPIQGLISGLATETYVNNKVNSEGARAISAEASLLASINSESTRATNRENELELSKQNKLTAGANIIISSEGIISATSDVTKEYVDEQDTILLNAINSEGERATAAEESIIATIELLEDDVRDLENTVFDSEGNSKIEINKNSIEAVDARVDDVEATLETQGNRITTIETTLPTLATKVYVDSESNNIKTWANTKFLTEHQSLADYRKAADQDTIDSNQNARIVAIEGQEAYWNAKSDFSGSYTDLTDKPTIPSKVSDLPNDVGYVTNAYHDATKQDKLPTVVNDRYLHSTSEGTLEWSEVKKVNGVITSDTLTDGKIWTGTKSQYKQLDSEGKISNNTLYNITDDGEDDSIVRQLLDVMYPIGAIYTSINNTHPNVGIWTRLATGRCLWNVESTSASLGNEIAAGLPNITGTYAASRFGCYESGVAVDGAFYNAGIGYAKTSVLENYYNSVQIGFNASNSNAIYGNSTTVQPPAIGVTMWERTA